MNTDTITVRPTNTLELVLRYLRRHDSLPAMTDTIYVVTRDDRLLGRIPLLTLLVSDPQTTINELMLEDLEGIPVTMEARKVAQLFEQYDWVSAPVVDEAGKLLGRITIDDVVDVIRDSTEHSLTNEHGRSRRRR